MRLTNHDEAYRRLIMDMELPQSRPDSSSDAQVRVSRGGGGGGGGGHTGVRAHSLNVRTVTKCARRIRSFASSIAVNLNLNRRRVATASVTRAGIMTNDAAGGRANTVTVRH
jgi:hypothetical protein